jgi:arylsulfatase A-like enzyme
VLRSHIAILAGVVGVCLLLASACEDTKPSRPNVVLIVVDTLRADHVGAYGGAVATPAMDAIAEGGARFDAAYAHAPMTAPSHASMFTGLMPRQHGLLNNGRRFDPPGETLAEVLRAAGYQTAAFVSLEVLSSRFGWDRGFDSYGESFEGGWWRTADQVNEDVLPWVRAHAREPFFLFVHYSDPHEPYLPPERAPGFQVRRAGGDEGGAPGELLAERTANGLWSDVTVSLEPGETSLVVVRDAPSPWPLRITSVKTPRGITSAFGAGFAKDRIPADVGQGTLTLTSKRSSTATATIRLAARPVLPPVHRRQLYGEEVAYVDGAIASLREALDGQGLTDRTLVVLTSDHGEMLGERPGGRFGHVHDLYEELIRVPWLMAWPGRVPPRQVESYPVRHMDLAPTILHFVDGVALPSARGRTAWPPHGVGDRAVVAETHPPQARAHRWAVRLGTHKVVRNESTGDTEVFDLGLDPGERRTVDQMAEDVVKAAAGEGRGAPRPEQDLSEHDREALRALGYIE